MSEKHIEIKIGQDPPHTTDFTAIVDVETGGRLFYEEVFPKHAERFVKCWNSHDALLAACKAVWDDTKGLSPSDYVKLDTFQKIKAAIALAEK